MKTLAHMIRLRPWCKPSKESKYWNLTAYVSGSRKSEPNKKETKFMGNYLLSPHALPPPPVLINQGEYNMVVNKSISQVSQLQHLQFIFALIFSREMVIHGQWIAWLIENIYLANILKSTFSVFMNTQSEKWIVDVVAAKLMKYFYWFIIHTIS